MGALRVVYSGNRNRVVCLRALRWAVDGERHRKCMRRGFAMQVRVLSVCTAVVWRSPFVLLWPGKGGVDAALAPAKQAKVGVGAPKACLPL